MEHKEHTSETEAKTPQWERAYGMLETTPLGQRNQSVYVRDANEKMIRDRTIPFHLTDVIILILRECSIPGAEKLAFNKTDYALLADIWRKVVDLHFVEVSPNHPNYFEFSSARAES